MQKDSLDILIIIQNSVKFQNEIKHFFNLVKVKLTFIMHNSKHRCLIYAHVSNYVDDPCSAHIALLFPVVKCR